MNLKTPPLYYKTYVKLKDETDYRFKLLVEGLEFESGYPERFLLYEDILKGDISQLQYIFSATKYDNVESVALSELTSLPALTLRRDAGLFERIMLKAMDNKYEDKTDTVFGNMIALYSKKEPVFSFNFIVEIISSPLLNVRYKIRLFRALSECEHASFLDWDSIDLEVEKAALPAAIYYYSQKDPIRALELLWDIDEDFAHGFKKFFYLGIEETLLGLIKENAVDKFFESESKFTSKTIKNVVKQIIGLNPILDYNFSTDKLMKIAKGMVGYSEELRNFNEPC